jgi:hypothetical protein
MNGELFYVTELQCEVATKEGALRLKLFPKQ